MKDSTPGFIVAMAKVQVTYRVNQELKQEFFSSLSGRLLHVFMQIATV